MATDMGGIGNHRPTLYKAFGVERVAVIQCLLLVDRHLLISTSKDLLWREACQATVVVFEVIPVEVVFAPTPGVGHASKTTRVVWLVLLGSKLALTEGVVIAHAGPAMTAGHIHFFIWSR